MDELSLAQILVELPEARDLLPTANGYRWSSEANLAGVFDEITAMRQSESLGYLHHAEMHRRHALALLLQALEEQESPDAPPIAEPPA